MWSSFFPLSLSIVAKGHSFRVREVCDDVSGSWGNTALTVWSLKLGWSNLWNVISCKAYIPIWGQLLKWWVSPTNPWVFLLKLIILEWRLGVPPFKETPICCRLLVGDFNQGQEMEEFKFTLHSAWKNHPTREVLIPICVDSWIVLVIYGRTFWISNSQKHPKGIYYWGFLIFTVFPSAEVVVELNRTEILSSDIIQ